MDLYHKILAIAAAVFLIIVFVVAFLYMRSSEIAARADERNKATQEVMAQDAQKQKERDAADAAYHAQVSAQIADMAKTYALIKAAPPQQQVAWSQEQLKEALKGITITVNPQTGAAEAVIPKESVPQLPQVIEQCKECSTKLDASLHDVSSRDATIKQLTGENLLLKKDNNDLATTLKGGTFWHRTKIIFRNVICGGGGAAFGASTAANKTKGAALGAVIGIVGCELGAK